MDVNEIARRQSGVFNLHQLTRAGVSDKVIESHVRSGSWVRLDSAVYALAAAPGTYLRQCWAAVLGNPGSAIAGVSAAALLGFDGIRAGRVEIVVPPTANARCKLARVHRFDGARVTKFKGLPITTRAQTLFDVARRVSFEQLEAAVDGELLRGRLAMDDLEERARFYADFRRAGMPVMRALLEDRRKAGWEPVASHLERRMDKLIARLSGRPRVVREVSFRWLDRGRARVDRYLPDEGIILEIDGRRWHARLRDFDNDRWRDNLIAAHGLIPLRFTHTHVTTRAHEVVELVERTRRLPRAA